MKKIIYLIALAVLVLTGCNKEPQSNDSTSFICGEWRSMTQEEADVAAIYISFAADGTFELYQNLKGTGYEVFRGKWSLDGNILSGEYNDGEAWAYTYTALGHDKFLTLTTIGDDAIEYNFVNAEIPSVIKEAADVIVKSSY